MTRVRRSTTTCRVKFRQEGGRHSPLSHRNRLRRRLGGTSKLQPLSLDFLKYFCPADKNCQFFAGHTLPIRGFTTVTECRGAPDEVRGVTHYTANAPICRLGFFNLISSHKIFPLSVLDVKTHWPRTYLWHGGCGRI